jgi:hypothetical protein
MFKTKSAGDREKRVRRENENTNETRTKLLNTYDHINNNNM